MQGERVVNPYTGRLVSTRGKTYTRLFPTGKIMLDAQSDDPELRANAQWYFEALMNPEKFGFKSVRGVRMSRTYDLNHTTPNKKGMTTLIDNPDRYANNPHLFDYANVDNGTKKRKAKKIVDVESNDDFDERAEALEKRIAALKIKNNDLEMRINYRRAKEATKSKKPTLGSVEPLQSEIPSKGKKPMESMQLNDEVALHLKEDIKDYKKEIKEDEALIKKIQPVYKNINEFTKAHPFDPRLNYYLPKSLVGQKLEHKRRRAYWSEWIDRKWKIYKVSI